MKERVGWQPVLQVSETSINKQDHTGVILHTPPQDPAGTYLSRQHWIRCPTFFSLSWHRPPVWTYRSEGSADGILTAQSSFMEGVSEAARAVCHAGVRSPKWVTYRKSYLEQIWSALPQIAD